MCFKPVRTGFPIQRLPFSSSVCPVSSLFEQDSLFSQLAHRYLSELFQACSNRIPYSADTKAKEMQIVSSLFEQDSLFSHFTTAPLKTEFQACSNRIPYSAYKLGHELNEQLFQACSNRIPYSAYD